MRSISACAWREPPNQRCRNALLCALRGGILRDPQVLPDRQLPEQPDVLECARDALRDAQHAAATPEMSAPRNRTWPAVGANRPQIRLTIVLLPEPLGPMRPRISPSETARSTPSTARTPPKCLVKCLELKHWRVPCCGSTAAHALDQAPESKCRAGIEQAARPDIHGEHDQSAEQQVAPIAHEAQAFDQEGLDEDDGDERAEHIGEAAEDRIGDREGGQHNAELHVLDMRGVVRKDAAAEAGDHAADGHGRDLDRRDIDADALGGEFVLADGAQDGAGARAVHPPQRRHHQRDHGPDEQYDIERGPAVFGKVADLLEALAAVRADPDLAARQLVGEVEEEQPHRLAEGERGHHQHEPLHPQRREADRARDHATRQRRHGERRDQRPSRQHGEHAGDIGADREEAGLGKADLAGQQHAIGRQADERVDADDLDEAEIEIHRAARRSLAPGRS